MKRAVRILLLAACLPLAACETADTLRKIQAAEEFQSGGPAAEPPLSVLAIAANPGYTPDTSPDAPALADQEEVKRFAQGLAQKFPVDFPPYLQAYGVAAGSPGKGVPLLRVYVATVRKRCYQEGRSCETEARLDGSLIGSSGKRDWWFNYWITVDDFNDATYRNICKRLAAEMLKAQVVTAE
jgi:hypothetical protein